MKGDGTVNQGFLLSKKDNERLEVKLKEIGKLSIVCAV
jgi:hypothetical protein